ncbi:unnamed protein product [Rotaria socialis]
MDFHNFDKLKFGMSLLPDDIFMRVDNNFFSVVKTIAGDSVVKILKIQLINSARKLLCIPYVFEFLRIDSEEVGAIKLESCFKSKTGQYVIKPGVQSGKQTYEFICLNLYGSILNLTTLGDLIKTSNMALNEAEFRFEYLPQLHSSFGFCSEDTTGVIRKVEYDCSTNSFVRFATPVTDGVPLSQYFQVDTFNDIKEIYDMSEQARLLNVHMFQGIHSDDNTTSIPRPFLLSAYGINNNFTALDVLQRWLYIYRNCLKNGVRVIDFSTGLESAWYVVFVCRIWWSWLKKESSSSSSKRTTACEQQNHINKYFITKPAYLSVEPNAHNMLYMVLLVKQHSLPKQALINIHLFNSQGYDKNDDDNVLNDEQNQLDDEALLDFENDDDVVDEEDVLTSTKFEFNGIRVFDDIDPNLKQSYFKIKLNDKIKYLHKQSACWLLSNKITKLSSDRLSRCKQQSS